MTIFRLLFAIGCLATTRQGTTVAATKTTIACFAPIAHSPSSQTLRLKHTLHSRGRKGRGGEDASSKMPRGVKKENLPSKVCLVCNRPFTWRKKWETCWDEVTTCSKSCNGKRRSLQQQNNRLQSDESSTNKKE
jgi:hypothetical protein